MYSIKLHFRPSMRQGRTDGKLFLRLICARKSGNITLPYRLRATEWDPLNHKLSLINCHPNRLRYLMELQQILDKEEKALRLLVSEFEEMDDLDIGKIISVYRTQTSRQGLSVFIQTLVGELREQKRERTARAYQTAWRRLLLYSGQSDLSANDVTESLIKGFERLLQSQKCSLNTISFYMRNLRAIYNKGKAKGIFPKNSNHPFSHVYTKIANTRKRALSKEDIHKLNCLDETKIQQLHSDEKDALYLFLFAFHACGMSFVDLAYLRKTDIKGNTLSYYRKKTGRLIQIKVSDEMKRCINYFRPRMKNSPYIFPIIRNPHASVYNQYCTGLRTQNQRLKCLKQKVGIKKELSTHMARHSWATIARSESVSVDVISEALGHSFVSTTYIYLDSFGTNVIGLANKRVSRAVGTISSI